MECILETKASTILEIIPSASCLEANGNAKVYDDGTSEGLRINLLHPRVCN
jgi:hypothetical protein